MGGRWLVYGVLIGYQYRDWDVKRRPSELQFRDGGHDSGVYAASETGRLFSLKCARYLPLILNRVPIAHRGGVRRL